MDWSKHLLQLGNKPHLIKICLVFILAVVGTNLGMRPQTAQGSDNMTKFVVEFTAGDPQFYPSQAGGRACLLLSLPGYSTSNLPGLPLLPVKGDYIGMPPGSQLKSQVIEAETSTLALSAPICPSAEPVFEEKIVPTDSDTTLNPLQISGERAVWDDAFYQVDQWSPQSAFSVAPAGMIRSQAVAQVQFHPIQYNPLRSELRFTNHLVLEISFSTPKTMLTSEAAFPSQTEGFFEATLRQTLLNYTQARLWRVAPDKSLPTVRPAHPSQTDDSVARYKILIDQDGLYQLEYDDLVVAGVPIDAWDAQRIQIVGNGKALPIQVTGEADGKFEPGDGILFYAQKLNNKYTDNNVYWLYEDLTPGVRMPILDGAPGLPALTPAYFTYTRHLEEDHVYQSSRPSGINRDHWYWDYLQNPSSPARDKQVFKTTLSSLSNPTGTAHLRGVLKGYSGAPSQRSLISINGNLIDDSTWSSGGEYAFDLSFPQTYLQEGENQITIEAPLGGGITSQTFLVNWFELDYARDYALNNDQLFFSADAPGDWEFHLSGVTTDTLRIYEITQPDSPVQVSGAALSGVVGDYTYTFRHYSPSSPPKFLALTTANYLKPLSIEQDFSDDLLSASNTADYLVITHGDFVTQAQRLADFRAGQGYRVKVVDVEDIYDLFGQGDLDPLAIHDFLAYAYQNWTPPAPSFVLLFGDGHYDFKNFLGYNQPFFIPPYLDDVDPFLGETAADNRFVTISGNDILPDMHIGRLPANNLTEATDMVDKIIAYETTVQKTDSWYKKVLFTTDNPDSGGDFYTLSDNVADNYLPPEYIKDKVYLGQNYSTAAEAKNAIMNAINQGRLIVSYVGHASVQWWAYEKLLSKDDVPLLNNRDFLTFFTPMTCLEGYFINPASNSQSLAEVLLRAREAGSLASWSPTGLGVATGHDILQRGLFLALFQDKISTLGPATTQAKYFFTANTTGFRDLLDTYLLLGDPASRLNTLDQFSGLVNYLPMVMR